MSTATAAVARERQFTSATRVSPSFWGAIQGEMLKLRRQRATWVMLGLGVGLFLILIAAMTSAPDIKTQLERFPGPWYNQLLNIFTSVFDAGAGIFLLIASARLVAMEYSGGTIRVILGRGTGRLQLLTAKLVTLAVTGLLLLVGFLVVSAIAVYLIVSAWEGSFTSVATLPDFWHNLGIEVGVACISVLVNILLGTAAAVLGRSLAFGLGAAMAFFPADNLGTIVMALLYRLTHQDFWREVTAYFLGPNLNLLQSKLIPGLKGAFAEPLVSVSTTHVWGVIGGWAAAFLLIAVVLTARRDVLQ